MSRDVLDNVEECIQTILHAQLRGYSGRPREVPIDSPILGRGLGLDSVEALALVTEIENEFNIFFDDEELTTELFASIGSLAAQVRKKLAGTSGDHR